MAKAKVDLTGVESFVKAEEGKHRAKFVELTLKENNSGDEMIAAVLEVVSGPSKEARVYDNYTLTKKALWKLKQVLQSLGMKAEGRIVLDTDKMLGRQVIIEVFHEEYNGQMRAKIANYEKVAAEAEEDEFDDEEDEEAVVEEKAPPAKKSRSKKKAPPAKEPEEDEEDDWEEA